MSGLALGARARTSSAAGQLRGLAAGLQAVANGEGARAANARIQPLFEAIAESELPKHKRSGNALAVVRVIPDGRGVAVEQPRYLRYQAWWSFARGVPPFALRSAAKIYREELQKLLAP